MYRTFLTFPKVAPYLAYPLFQADFSKDSWSSASSTQGSLQRNLELIILLLISVQWLGVVDKISSFSEALKEHLETNGKLNSWKD